MSVGVSVRGQEEDDGCGPGPCPTFDACARGFLDALSASVRARVQNIRLPPGPPCAGRGAEAEGPGRGGAVPAGEGCAEGPLAPAAVLVLFSGGLDSAVVARLAHDHCPPGEPIDLASVCFAGGQSADRLAARTAVDELRRAAPGREWRLIEARGRLPAHFPPSPYPCNTGCV